MNYRRGIKAYLLLIGAAVNILFLIIGGYILSEKVGSHYYWKQLVRFARGPIDNSDIVSVSPVFEQNYNKSFLDLPRGKWAKIHHQKSSDPVIFYRQRHAGSAFDSKRGRLIIFGSDTHGEDWTNVLRIFDVAKLQWELPDKISDYNHYSVNSDGIPVAENGLIKPWAMHTFDAVEYDAAHDRLVVASHPKHLVPGRHGDWMARVWNDIKRHPTWFYDFKEAVWRTSTGKDVSFFPYATAYNTSTNEFIGFRPDGVFKLLDGGGWIKIGKKSVNAYHTNAIYDSRNRAFVIFGVNTLSNAVYVVSSDDYKTREMATPGERPPGTQSVPLAYHPVIGKTIALVDSPEGQGVGAQTWLYDLQTDSWNRISTADFPYKLGMNYNMQYDSIHNQLILVANAPNELPSVWVLRL